MKKVLFIAALLLVQVNVSHATWCLSEVREQIQYWGIIPMPPIDPCKWQATDDVRRFLEGAAGGLGGYAGSAGGPWGAAFFAGLGAAAMGKWIDMEEEDGGRCFMDLCITEAGVKEKKHEVKDDDGNVLFVLVTRHAYINAEGACILYAMPSFGALSDKCNYPEGCGGWAIGSFGGMMRNTGGFGNFGGFGQFLF